MKPALELLPALAVMALRAFLHPPPILVLDPVFVLAALWIVIVAARNPRIADAAVVATSLLLFVAYAWRQIPFAVDLLRQTL